MENNKDVIKTATEYFENLKEKKNTVTDEDLLKVYKNAEKLLKKALITKQEKAISKLLFHLETIEKERKLVKKGVDTFIYRDDIEEYIDSVDNEVVKIIELSRYEREIPDEIVEVIKYTQDIFDEMYVLFTDYTKKEEKKVLQKRTKEKDPILFGTFQSLENHVLMDRFYFLGDWEDEFCDLTLDKMVSHMKISKNKDIENKIATPLNLDEIRSELNSLKEDKKLGYKLDSSEKENKKHYSIINKIMRIFKNEN